MQTMGSTSKDIKEKDKRLIEGVIQKKKKQKKKKKERKLKKAIATIEKNELLMEELQGLVKKSNMYIAYLDGKVTGLTDLTTKLCSNSMNDIIHLDSDGEKELKW